MLHYLILISTIQGKKYFIMIKRSCRNNKYKVRAHAWNDEFELPEQSYHTSNIQDYCEYIIKKHERMHDSPLIQIYINKIENRNTFQIKTGHYLELSVPETMTLLGSTKYRSLMI